MAFVWWDYRCNRCSGDRPHGRQV